MKQPEGVLILSLLPRSMKILLAQSFARLRLPLRELDSLTL